MNGRGATGAAARRWGVIAAGILLLSSCDSSCGSRPPPQFDPNRTPLPTQKLIPTTPTGVSTVQWSISPIGSVFDPGCFCTRYRVKVAATRTNSSNDQWTITWSIAQILVDSAGAPDPAQPGSAAATDPACNNHGDGVQHVHASTVEVVIEKDDTFTWYHPDATSAPPGFSAGQFDCDHTKQGPHGHQGLIKVVATHGAQQCSATYMGTHTGISTDADQPGPPACTRP
jgi:hypothetical protein